MKKSSTLMLSYVVFLIICILAYAVFDWNGLERIAISATVAGFFFAFADLSGSQYASSSLLNSVLSEYYEYFSSSRRIQTSYMKSLEKRVNEISLTAAKYSECNETISRILNDTQNTFHEIAQREELVMAERSEEKQRELQSHLVKQSRTRSFYSVFEIVMLTLGFLSFFAMLTFDELLKLLLSSQTLLTVSAFLTIVVNYLISDIFDEKEKSLYSKLHNGITVLKQLDEQNNEFIKDFDNHLSEVSSLINDLIRDECTEKNIVSTEA